MPYHAVTSRRERVLAELERTDWDFLLASTPGAIAYLTDLDVRPFSGSGSAVVIKRNGDVVLLISEADRAFIDDAEYAGEIKSWPIGPDATVHRNRLVTGETCSTSGARPRGAVEARSPVSYRDILASARPEAEIGDAESIIDAAARIKDADELRRIRQAANLADIGYTAVVDRIHPELRVLEITRNVDRSVRAAGGGGYWSPIEADIGTTAEALYPHNSIATLIGRRHETGTLDPSRPLPFALYPLSEVYAGAAGTTITLTPPSGELRSRAEMLAEAVQEAIAAVQPGATGGEVQSAFARRLGAHEASKQAVGYGIGTGISRPYLSVGSRQTLAPGMAISIRAALPGVDEPPVTYQTTVLVTDGGNELLNIVPLRLIELY